MIPAAFIEAGLAFARVVMPIAVEHKASVTSWYRTPKRQRMVSPNRARVSFHPGMLAMDFVCDDENGAVAFIEACRAAGLDVVPEGDHIHVEADYKSKLAMIV